MIIENYIIFFRFFVYFTHITQLLNIKVFQVYKQYYSNIIDKFVKQKNVQFGKLNFLNAFQKFRDFIFKKAIIQKVWRKIDFVFFDFEVILRFIRENFWLIAAIKMKIETKKKERRFYISNDRGVEFDFFTHTFVHFVLYQKIVQHFREMNLHNLIFTRFYRFFKVCDCQWSVFDFCARDLKNC